MLGKTEKIVTVIALCIALLSPATAFAHSRGGKPFPSKYPNSVSKWSSIIHEERINMGIKDPTVENMCKWIMLGESGGNQYAKTGSCWGLLQNDRGQMIGHTWMFKGKSWVKGDWRLNGRASIRVFMYKYKHNGIKAIKKHWAATWN
jgi:hypothetical protein